MNYRFVPVVLMFAVVFISCKNDKKEPEPEVVTVETTSEKEPYTSAEGSATFNDDAVGEIFARYIDLKTTLVNTNSEEAAVAAENLMTAFSNKGVSEEAMAAIQEIVDAGGSVEKQRTAFEAVTGFVESMLEGALESGTIYKQYCPMAFNNKGAYWLSNSKEIYNPYFGDVMLRCGRIDAEIK